MLICWICEYQRWKEENQKTSCLQCVNFLIKSIKWYQKLSKSVGNVFATDFS